MSTTTQSLTNDPIDWLRADVAELRAEIVKMRTELSTEVRTRRLVVVDEAGNDRIATDINSHHTWLRLRIVDGSDRVGFGLPSSATLLLSTDLEGDGFPDGNAICKAAVDLSTGDDSYVLLEQQQLLSEDGRQCVERGTLTLYQQTSTRDRSGEMGRHHCTQIVVDRHGIAETDGEVIAYALMQRVR